MDEPIVFSLQFDSFPIIFIHNRFLVSSFFRVLTVEFELLYAELLIQ